MELELPRLLAPDLPSNCSSLRDLNCTHSNYKTQKSPVSLFIVTTSPCRDWVICAPAAFLGCGSRFSGSLSGIEPLFPVTRWNHGRPLSYHRKLIGQIFEWSIAGTRPCDSRSYYESPRERRAALAFYLINTPLPRSRGLIACISSRITTVIHVARYHQINYNWFNEPFAVSQYKVVYT